MRISDWSSDVCSSDLRILDLGTGSGALLLAALSQWPRASGVGIDISPAELAIAQGNADRLGLSRRADFRTGDWAEGVDGPFGLILFTSTYYARDSELAGGGLPTYGGPLLRGPGGSAEEER